MLKEKLRKLDCGWLGSRTTSARGTVALGELVHASGGVDEALFTREVRVAGSTDTDAEVLHGGDGIINGTTGASDGRFVCSRM
jgi:hypothetical protein